MKVPRVMFMDTHARDEPRIRITPREKPRKDPWATPLCARVYYMAYSTKLRSYGLPTMACPMLQTTESSIGRLCHGVHHGTYHGAPWGGVCMGVCHGALHGQKWCIMGHSMAQRGAWSNPSVDYAMGYSTHTMVHHGVCCATHHGAP